MPCPKCGASDNQVHPVWTEQQEQGEHPKYIACEGCRNLIDPNDFIHGQSENVGQAHLTDHEISRLKIGNQHSDDLTVVEWQAVKGAAVKFGVTDWTAKVDSSLTHEENIALMRKHGTETGQSIKYVAAVDKARQRTRDDRRNQ
jgi:hypothetical protein